MKGITVEMVASSWIEALGGLSRWVTLSVPPAFCADAGAALATTKRAAIEAAMKPRILFPPDLAWPSRYHLRDAGRRVAA